MHKYVYTLKLFSCSVNFNEFPGVLSHIDHMLVPGHSVRHGSQDDLKELTSLFEQLGFKIFKYEDLERSEFLRKVLDFSEDEKHGDVVVVVVMSHGTRDIIQTSDNKELDIENDIIRYFNNENKNLKGKPKIIIFQSCRGHKRDSGVYGNFTFYQNTYCSGSFIYS